MTYSIKTFFLFSLLAFFHVHAITVYIFDFDQTITKNHTFRKTQYISLGDLGDVKTEIRPNISKAFQNILQKGDRIALSTFHTRKDVLQHYLGVQGAGLTEEQLDGVIIRYRTEVNKHYPENKIEDINAIVAQIEEEIKDEVNVIFYDDDEKNILEFKKHFGEINLKYDAVNVPFYKNDLSDENYLLDIVNPGYNQLRQTMVIDNSSDDLSEI